MKKLLVSLLAVAVLSCSIFATVTNENRKISYVIDGSSEFTFSYTFDIISPGDVSINFFDVDGSEVVVAMARTTDSTPAANEFYVDETNGNIVIGGTGTLRTQYETSIVQLLITRTVNSTQESAFPTATALRSKAIETALDKNVMLVQQLNETIGRALVIPIQDDTSQVVDLPPAAVRAGKFLAFDALGNPTVGDTPTGTVVISTAMEPVVGAATILVAKALMNLDNVFNVKDFGAVGDGSTDDTIAINLATTAANTAGGGTVFIPKGEYKLTSSLVLHSNTTLVMDTETILLRNFSGDAAVATFSAKNGTIRNATKDVSNRDSNITIIGGQLYSDNVSFVGNHLLMWGVDNFRMEGTRVRQAYGNDQGLIYRGDNAIFSNLNIDVISDTSTEPTPNDGLHIASGTNIRISNCYIKAEDDSIALANYDDEGNSAISDVTITNCVLVSNRNNIKIGHNWNVSGLIQRITISNCVGFQTGTGGSHLAQNVTILPENGSADGKILDIAISNCVFRSDSFAGFAANNSHGVFVKGADNVSISNVWVKQPNRSGFWIENCNNVQIIGGGVISPRNSAYRCIEITASDDVTISDGYFHQPLGTQNLFIQGACDNIKIINNTFTEIVNDSSGIATNTGSVVDGLIIEGNMFDKAGATGYGYQAEGTETNILFVNNDCRGVTKGIKVIGDINSGLIVRGNLGYVTENGAKASGISTGQTIAHGLAETPSIVNVVPATAGVSDLNVAVDGTNITVTFGGGGSEDFFWEAKVN